MTKGRTRNLSTNFVFPIVRSYEEQFTRSTRAAAKSEIEEANNAGVDRRRMLHFERCGNGAGVVQP